MFLGTETEPAREAGAHAEEAFNPGESILHHVLDAHEIEIPFTQKVIPLPELHLWGHDVSITKHVVMMWIASAFLLLLFVLASRRAREPVPRGLRNVLRRQHAFVHRLGVDVPVCLDRPSERADLQVGLYPYRVGCPTTHQSAAV